MLSQKLKQFIPFLILFAFLGLLAQQLFYAKKNELPSALVGKPLPTFALTNLISSEKILTNNDLFGQVSLLNVWATWCEACIAEHAMLLKIKEQYHIPIYAIDYKDNIQDAQRWLQRNGNPYIAVGNDTNGDVAIDLGVYGTPETFVVSPKGKILYRHIGVIDEKVWNEVLYPLIKQHEAS